MSRVFDIFFYRTPLFSHTAWIRGLRRFWTSSQGEIPRMQLSGICLSPQEIRSQRSMLSSNFASNLPVSFSQAR